MDAVKISLCEGDKEALYEALQDTSDLPALVASLEKQGVELVPEVCKQGFSDILHFLRAKDIAIFSKNYKETALQTACRHGQAEIVDLLLLWNADLTERNIQPWNDKSPFYIATRYGHSDVLDRLINHAPCTYWDLVKTEEVRGCLLYAACLGGSYRTVKRWVAPDIDINIPVKIVDYSDVQVCEQMTPMFAACSGGHIEVVKFLYDSLEAKLTGNVCQKYPEVIGQVLQPYFKQVSAASSSSSDEEDILADELFQLYKGELSRRELSVLHPSWLLPYAVTLVDLDVSNNSLTELPSCVPWEFQNLRLLKASQNAIKELSGPKSVGDTDINELCPSLEEVNLSHNQLENVCRELFRVPSLRKLKLDHNKIVYLVRSIHQKGEEQLDSNSTLFRQATKDVKWECPELEYLDISHNSLQVVPNEIQRCSGLRQLYVQNNELTTFPRPWECPLTTLNLGHNNLERFPVDVEQFWCSSLRYLYVSYNSLEEVNESIVKLGVLLDFDASHNKIERLPVPEVWTCGELFQLNLKHNRLGQTREPLSPKLRLPHFPITRRRLSRSTDSRLVSFPAVLAGCLRELRLADNNLDCVPDGVSQLQSLEILDLSKNPIKTLPKELGRLQNCTLLKLQGLELDNVPQDYITGGENKTKEILCGFLDDLRDCQPYYKMKLVVLGKKDKGKTTLVNRLAGKKQQTTMNREGIVKEEVTLSKRKGSGALGFLKLDDKKPDIRLSVWDMAGEEAYALTHQCVFTAHSLYLLVWDIWTVKEEREQVDYWVYNIKASTPNSRIILVGTFLDKMSLKSEQKLEMVADLEKALNPGVHLSQNEKISVCPVSCVTGEGFEDLKMTIHDKASSMEISGRRRQKLIGQKVPRCYITMETLISKELARKTSEKQPPFLTQEEFDAVIDKLPEKDMDITTPEEKAAVTRFLVESGSLLHYTDQLGALNTLYFLDPAWLCEALVKVILKGGKMMEGGKIERSKVQNLYEQDERFPIAYIDQYIKLLERFEIAVAVQNQKLYFPSKLPEQRPGLQLPGQGDKSKRISRLFKMAVVPSGFWTRLLTRLMIKVEDFSSENWFHKPNLQLQSIRGSVTQTSLKGFFHRELRREESYRGLQIKTPMTVYWREGMYVGHEEGYFQVEPVHLEGSTGSHGNLQEGVLVTEQSSNNNFAIMGIIVDEIEDIVQDFYPGLLDPDPMTMQFSMERYAVCPVCYQDKADLSCSTDHFTVEMCARLLSMGNQVKCMKQGVKLHLPDLVPDLLMHELPERFLMDADKLHLNEHRDNLLGEGVTGAVYRGRYGDEDVAVKLYRSDIRYKSGKGQYASVDSGTSTMSSVGSASSTDENEEDYYSNFTKAVPIDLDEVESIKAFQALRDMRQEVALTSRLQHPCIVALVGILFRPKLMMALQLAPLGSLRKVLDENLKTRPKFDKYRDKHKVIPLVFSKDMTFKIIYQIEVLLKIAKGLEYLHANGIIYKDLKSDNILVMSDSLGDLVNVKLSDYGISKYCWSGSSVGMVGTPGYQAPEILDGLAYDEKVDIFAFAMVIYEVMSGLRPYQEYSNLSQIAKAIKTKEKRPHLQDYNVYSQFPYLEDLMMKCWNSQAANRPHAHVITSKRCMASCQFLCQAAAFSTKDNQTFGADILLGAPNPETSLLWMWEGRGDSRCCTVLDTMTSQYRLYKEKFEGPGVVCMARVGENVWVGTEGLEIEVYGSDSRGTVTKLSTIALSSVPVQIVTPTEQVSTGRSSVTVYVAVKDCSLYLYQSETRRPARTGKSMRAPEGFKEPKSLMFRTDELFCMTLVESCGEIWVSVENTIEIVETSRFKVERDFRISLAVLNKLCNIPAHLNVMQMMVSQGVVWCLLQESPYVLQFDASSHRCLNIVSCDQVNILRAVVIKPFRNEDNVQYIGADIESVDPVYAEVTAESVPQPPPRRVEPTDARAYIEPQLPRPPDLAPPPIPAHRKTRPRPPSPEGTAPVVPPRKASTADSASNFKKSCDSLVSSSPDLPPPPVPAFRRTKPRPTSPEPNAALTPPGKTQPAEASSSDPDSNFKKRCGSVMSSSSHSSCDTDDAANERFGQLLHGRFESFSSDDSSTDLSAGQGGTSKSSSSKVSIPSIFLSDAEARPPDHSWKTCPPRLATRRIPAPHPVVHRKPGLNIWDAASTRPESDEMPPSLPPRSPHSNRYTVLVDTPERKPVLTETISKSLPRMFRSSERHVAENEYSTIVKSVACVGNSLWLGRSSGDICILNINQEDNSSTKFGRVVSVLHDVLVREQGSVTEEGVDLTVVGNYVVAAYHVRGDNHASTRVASWDCIDAVKVKEMQKYWEKIAVVEKKLYQGSSVDDDQASLTDVGTF